MVLTVHHLGHSQSDRVVWLCEELGIEYELKKYDRAPLLAPPEFKALHPIGAAPVIEDYQHGRPVKLAESEACIEYIAQVHGGGRLTVGPGASNYADYLYWYHAANGTLQPTISRVMSMGLAGLNMDNAIYALYRKKIDQVLKHYDERLAQSTWLAGEEFTLADVMTVFSFTTMREFTSFDLTDFPHVLAFVKRAAERPAYKKAVAKADPDINIEELIQGKSPLLFKNLRNR